MNFDVYWNNNKKNINAVHYRHLKLFVLLQCLNLFMFTIQCFVRTRIPYHLRGLSRCGMQKTKKSNTWSAIEEGITSGSEDLDLIFPLGAAPSFHQNIHPIASVCPSVSPFIFVLIVCSVSQLQMIHFSVK